MKILILHTDSLLIRKQAMDLFWQQLVACRRIFTVSSPPFIAIHYLIQSGTRPELITKNAVIQVHPKRTGHNVTRKVRMGKIFVYTS